MRAEDSLLRAGSWRPLVLLPGKEGSAAAVVMGALQPPESVPPGGSLRRGQWVNIAQCPARCGCLPAMDRSVPAPGSYPPAAEKSPHLLPSSVCAVTTAPRVTFPQQQARPLHECRLLSSCQSSLGSEAMSVILVTAKPQLLLLGVNGSSAGLDSRFTLRFVTVAKFQF